MVKFYIKFFVVPFIILISLFTSIEDAQASHGMGADITYECLGGYDYLIRLKFYRDCSGINVGNSQIASINGCGVSITTTLNLVSGPTEVSPLCPSALNSSTCNSGNLPGVQEVIYEGVVTINNLCQMYSIGWTNCCRNAGITTLDNPSTQNIYIEAMLDNTNNPCNNSPTFNNIPTPYVCLGQDISYNHGVTDADGDQLQFSLIDCEQAAGQSVDYQPGFSGTVPLSTTTGVNIDPNTGALSFTPSNVQIGVLCVLVEEFRNGIKIGETVRDMQFVVLNCSNTLPTASELYDDQGVSTGSFVFDVCNDQSFCLDILGEDLDTDDVFMTWNNGIPAGTFDVAGNFTDTPTGTFCWTPDITDVGTHFFTVNVIDDACPLLGQNTETYTINVYENVNDPVDAGMDQTICEGETTTLNATNATNAVSYTWTPTTGLATPNAAMTDASPIVTTTYTISTEHSDGCISQDFVTIFVDPTPVLTIFPNNLDICSGSDAVLIASTEPGVTMEWFENGVSIGPGTITGNTSTITVSPTATTTYTVEASFVINNCVVSDTSIISVGNPPPLATCVNIYVTPAGGGDGSQSSPTDLESAIDAAACNGSVIKIAVGTYNFNEPLQIPSYATLEGGFDPTTWVKTSLAGATTIHRTALGNDGTTNGPALIALLGNSDVGFRLQDITISTADGPPATATTPAYSTYGVYLTNCSTYDIVRTQILPGQGGTGFNGITPATPVADGEDAQDGLIGQDDTDDSEQHGARGGAGGGAGAGTRGWDGTWGCTMANANSDIFGNCSGCSVGCNGVDGGNSTGSFAGGGGGGGGGGGQEDRNGGFGGDGGSVPAGPGFGALPVNNTFGGPNVLGFCKPAAIWPGIESGCNPVNITRLSPESGRCGRDGDNGSNGTDGIAGTPGTFTSCFFVPGGLGTAGDRGQGGQGGSGGGGGAGEAGGSCTDGSGSSGGGGGGGGEAGYGGSGGSGGGGSFGILVSMNGAGGNLIESWVQTTSGIGGIGGLGSAGGVGGDGGIGGDPTSDEVGFGGNGGRGGDGGNGGNGGQGANGTSATVEVCSGAPLVTQITNFNLALQDEITVTNVNCTFNDVVYSGLNFFPWDLGAGATNPTPTGLMVTTQYTTIGRKDIIYGTNSYTGFHNISFDASIIPEIITDAPLIANDTFELCAGDVASFQSSLPGDNYVWDFDGAIPGVFVGPTFQNIAPTAFNTPNPPGVPFAITLSIETDCCGPSPLDTIWLYVDPVPVPTITGDNAICDGGSTILTVLGTNVDSVSWVPPGVVDVLSPTTAEVTLYTPGSVTISATVYYESDRPGASINPSYSCPVTETFTVTAFPPPTVTASFAQVGTCDYGVLSSVSPSAPPAGGTYLYEWDTGELTPSFAPAAPGLHCLTVTDSETGCTTTACVTVPFGAVPNPYIMTSTNLTCNGADDGSALAADANNVGTIYDWSGPGGFTATGAQINGLAPGQYCVTVTSPAMCESADICIDIYEPPTIDILVEDVLNSSCGNTPDGYAEINASGGAGTFTYMWSNGGMLDTIQNVSPGMYSVTVFDANGCFSTASVEILPSSTLPIAVTPINISCFGDMDGSVTSNLSGGTAPFTYIWSNSETTATISNLGPGNYDLTVSDAAGCITTVTTSISEPSEITGSAAGLNTICSGDQTNITLTGSEPGVTYSWTQTSQAGASGASNGTGATIAQTLQNSTNSSVTVTYTITPQGPAFTGNCDGDPFDFVVTIVPPILSAVDNLILNCSTDSNGGNLDLSVSGGQAPYTYMWDNGAGTSQDPTNLGSGTYSVTITDAIGCTNTNSAIISLPPVLTANAAQGATLLCNGDVTTATVTAGGGTPGYAYLWDSGANNQNTPTATGLGAGIYNVTVFDVNSCTQTATVTISQPTLISSSITFTDIICFGSCDGTATISPSGGVPPYTYLWNDAASQTTATATGLCPGTWNVQIMDANNCISTNDVTLSLPLVFSATVVGTPVFCNGESTGTATTSTVNGTAPVNYEWDNGETTQTATNLPGGPNTVTVTDDNDCVAIATVNILELPILTGNAIQISPVNCTGGSDGVATASATGGVMPYSFLWDNNETTQTSSNLNAGIHSVVISDTNGCTSTATVTIDEPMSLLTGSITMVMDASCNGDSDGSATVSITPSSGTAPYTYNWDIGQTNATAIGLGQGSFPVTITDANGCTTTLNAVISEPTVLLASAALGTGVLCFGESNGSATVTPSNGTPPYTFAWDNMETGATATGLSGGIHTVVVTDGNSCIETASVTITEPTQLSAIATLDTPVSCNGESNGQATVTITGGTPNYTIVWDNSETNTTATALSVGVHTVVITDANNCTATASVTITEPITLVSSSVQVSGVLCNGESNGSATASASNGTPGYTYLWDNAETDATATALSAGPHSVVITDANGCTSSASVTITEPILLTGSAIQVSPVACNGESNGSATVTASNGTPGYTFLWDNSETTATAISLASGLHNVVITDANGCTATVNVSITEPQDLVTVATQNTGVLCNGESNGSATVAASNGTPGYTYLWDNAETDATATALSVGPHTVVVTDINGCTETASVVISEPSIVIAAAVEDVPVSCNGGSDGQATVSISGGTPNYTILWDNNETNATATILTAGPHTVLVTDMNGCTETASVIINEPPLFTASILSNTDASCAACIGTANLDVLGGVAPYMFDWNNGNTTEDPTDLCSGINTVTVTDANGCTTTANVNIGNSTNFAVSNVSIDSALDCFGDCDGVATVTASGGQTPYSYVWDAAAGNQVTPTISGLCVGTYSVTITDTNGCVDVGSVVIGEPTQLMSIAAQDQPVTCSGGTDGSATVSASGGTPNYTYLWSNSETNATATNLSAGLQSVVVTDLNGCISTTSVMITEPTAIAPQIISNTPSSCTTCIGTADLEVTGGNPPYTYLWTNGSTLQDPTDLCSVLNVVTVTDASGCQNTASVSIGNSTNFSINTSSIDSNVSCFGVCDGQATVTGSGGQTPYQFVWSDGQTSSTATGLCAGTYNVTVTDANGCFDGTILTIVEPALLSATTTEISGVVCNGESNGVATVSATGGTIPYSYDWAIGGTVATISNLPAGIHTVAITDGNGCMTTSTVTITEPTLLTGSASQINGVLCNGESNGVATATGLGGTPPYSFLWDNAETSATASMLAMGLHTSTITDFVGCTEVVSVLIAEPVSLSTSNTIVSGVSCFGESDGSATVNTSGGTPPYSILWDNNETNATAIALSGGNHTVVVTDQNGCTSTATALIPEPTSIGVNVLTTLPANCIACDGGATISVTGGTMPYTYMWSNGSTLANPTDLCSGTTNLTVTDMNGCTATATASVGTISTLSIVSIGIDNNVSCNGVCDGQATVTISGGQSPYIYNWDNGQTSATATGLCDGISSLTVTDANGCVSTDVVTITEPTMLSGVASELMPVTCFNGSDGSATVSVTGGTIPYTYIWTSGSTTAISTGLSAGTESVTISDNNGCTSISSILITQPVSGLAFTLVSQTPSNCTACDGTASITVTGAMPPYTFIWSNGNTTEDPIDLCQGINSVTITDASGCQIVENVNINNVSTLGIGSESVDANVSCFGACDGQATITPSGGQLPYSYLWDASAGSQTTATATGLCAGTYFVTIVDPDGCLVAEDIIITEQPVLAAATTSSGSVSCVGQSDGTVSVTPTGGTVPYSYNWSNMATTGTVNALPAGTYWVTVTDQNGCTTTASSIITNPVGITASVITNALNCFGDTNGAIDLTVSGGSIPYTFNWSGGAPAVEDPTGLSAGQYDVTITDANGCTTTTSTTITEPLELVGTTTSTNTSCASVCDGSAVINVSGGTGAYTYLWSASAGSQITASVTGLCAGTHNVTATDANGCTEIQTVTISQPNLLTITTVNVTDVVCFGESNGIATANALGGTPPYIYSWDNMENTPTASQLDAGLHNVTATDANGCTAIGNITIIEPALLVVTITPTNITCGGAGDGSAMANAVGGNGGFTYAWDNSNTGQTAGPLGPGPYTVTVTDVLGCTGTASVIITEPLSITATSTSQDVTCLGDADGRGTIFLSGGVGPFSFAWDNAEITNPAIALTSGIHTVTITDANNCTAVETVTVGSPTQLTPNATTVPPTCFGQANGTGSATAVGGTAPYNFVWNTAPPQFGPQATGLPSGTFTLEVTDANGCMENITVTVDDAPSMISVTLNASDASCFGGSDGAISADVSGGTPSYTYQWSNGSTGQSAFNLDAGNYSVTIIDVNGCIEVASGTIGQPNLIVVDYSTTPSICFGEENGTIIIVDTTITGGVSPYSFSLNGEDFQMGNVFGGLSAGNYTLFVQDANGCIVDYQAFIDEPSELLVDVGVDLELELGDSTILDAIVTPSNIGVSYSWTPGEYLSCVDCASPTVTPFETTTYQVMVVDTISGCSAVDDLTIIVDKNRNIYIPNAFTPNEDGTNDVFMIYGGIGVSEVRTFNVYDRWGERVWQAEGFQPDDPVYGWDGTFRGKKLNPSVFVYFAEVEFVDGEVILYKGDVTLLK